MSGAREPIAVIGVAARFPGARDLDDFWAGLLAGRESVSRFTPDQLAAAGVPASEYEADGYVPARGVLDGVEYFDPEFFGMAPRESAITDPQHRLLLECAWEALEYAGHPPSAEPGRVGVFVGTGVNSYLANHVLTRPDLVEALGPLPVIIGNEKDHAATRIAYRLGLRGPAISVQTACSTALVAVHLACDSLRNGDSDLALAGAAAVSVPQHRGYRYDPHGVGAPDGHCRAFAADASGTVAGNGAGVVALRRAADAIAAGDPILGLILGSAVNNDGSAKVGYSAPSVTGQADVLTTAYQRAGIDPATIDVVEAHGTGTEVGDAIEVAALAEALGRGGRTAERLLGSVKPNVGHLDAAAGIAGLIKALLALQHGVVPPTINHDRPHPEITFGAAGFRVNTEIAPWPLGPGPRRAAVSSFGIGGTNTHLVLEQAPPRPARPASTASPELLLLSGRNAPAVRAIGQRLAEHLTRRPDVDLADVAHTCRTGRSTFAYRRAVVCHDRAELVRQLTTTGDPSPAPRRTTLAFVLPGQGSQYPGMAAELHRRLPVFRESVQECLAALPAAITDPVRAALLHPDADAPSGEELAHRPGIAQPALFVVEYALGRQLAAWGLRPDMLLGHSVGGYAAVCLAGGLSVPDALTLLAERGRLVERTPPGAMAALLVTPEKLTGLLPPDVGIAAYNAPEVTVVSGPERAVAALSASCATAGIGVRPLPARHGFHSALLDGVLAEFRQVVAGARHQPLTTTVLCDVTGSPLTAGQIWSPETWVRHLREPVRFALAAERILAARNPVVLEVGPGRALTALVRAIAGGRRVPVSPTMPAGPRTEPLAALLRGLATAWTAGVEVDWSAFDLGRPARRVPLPTYPFQRTRSWIDPPTLPDRSAPYSGPASDRPPVPDVGTAGAGPVGPDPDPGPPDAVAPDDLPGQVEHEIIAIWREALGVAEIDTGSDFFALGGESLVAVRMLARLRRRFGVRLSLRALAADPTVRGLTGATLSHLSAAQRPETP